MRKDSPFHFNAERHVARKRRALGATLARGSAAGTRTAALILGSTLPASQEPYAPTTARRRWARQRRSSRQVGSSGRRGRGWRKSPEQEARSNGIKRRVVRLVRHSMVSNRDGKPKKRAPMTPINPADEFLKHAAECQQMAKATRNPANKGTWNRMAERWLQCAERAKNQKVATRARTPIRRQVEVSSAHY